MINVVHVIDIAYVAHSLMKTSEHNSALTKHAHAAVQFITTCFREKRGTSHLLQNLKQLLVLVLRFQFLQITRMFSVDLLFMFWVIFGKPKNMKMIIFYITNKNQGDPDHLF